jgi:hypothetical protein
MNKLLFLGVAAALGGINQAWAAFSVDLTVPSLNSTYYRQSTSSQYIINADYAENGVAPNNMIVPPLAAGATMRLKVLLPPGTKQAVIRGESNDWIGAVGKQPAIAILNQDITGTCPVSVDSVSYSCNGVLLSPPSGGLSSQLYAGAELTLPQYAHFVLHNPAAAGFSFKSLSISIQIANMAAYNAWLSARPWAGGAVTNSTDGIGDTTSITPISSPKCDLTDANLLSTLDGALSLTLPRVKYLGGGLADMQVKLKQVFDPKNPGRYLFKPTDVQFLTCGQTLSK